MTQTYRKLKTETDLNGTEPAPAITTVQHFHQPTAPVSIAPLLLLCNTNTTTRHHDNTTTRHYCHLSLTSHRLSCAFVMTDPISAAAAASTKTATDAGTTVTGSTGTVTKELAPPPQDTAKNPAESEDDDDDETTSEPEIGAVATATATATVTTTAITNTDTDAADSNSKTGTTNASTTRPSTATTASPHNPAFSKELHAMCTNYNMNQRRAIQSAILLEAHRALIDHHPHKPSHTEHKQDFLSTASIILDTMDWIPQESKAEILVRTMTKNLPLTPELAYKRFKENLHYLSKTLIPKIMEFGYDFDISHEENCDAYLQHTFVSLMFLCCFVLCD
jgi:hypothetical protein